MKLRHTVLAAAAAIAAAGCGEKCPTETPKVNSVGSCTAAPNVTVTYPVQFCDPAGVTCDVDLSQVGTMKIQLDPKVEVCGGGSASCPASCAATPAGGCSFTAPAVPGTYDVFAFDSCTATTRPGTLIVAEGAPPTPDCTL